LLHALALLAPENVEVALYAGLGSIPPFNPDLDIEPPPSAVADFRAQLLRADSVVISSPEYAHGVSGVLKNAMDWLVRSGELYDKPVALINASPRASHAQASLIEILTTMGARLAPAACISVPILGSTLTPQQIASDEGISKRLRDSLEALASYVRDIKQN
jgi:NAD(P)H-dependent FMN reductase